MQLSWIRLRKKWVGHAFAFASASLCCGFSNQATAADLRKDTLDVISYDIHLHDFNIPGKTLKGNTAVKFNLLKGNVQTLRFDFLGLTLDSVLYKGKKVTHTRKGHMLHLQMVPAMASGEHTIQFYYHGAAFSDASGFGGVHFSNADQGYVYNLGIGFSSIPHNMGMTWFPCVDNFNDRATAKITLDVPRDKKGVANGDLLSEGPLDANTHRYVYQLSQTVPAYLFNFAVGNYTILKSTVHSANSARLTVPVWLACRPNDSAKALASFSNLQKGFSEMERLFGPYQWTKVGFVGLPMAGGAMEHATMVSFPNSSMAGSGDYEDLWIHELSHSWWGNLATCDGIEEMWLNEGWTSYCEALIRKSLYGEDSYRKHMLEKHYEALRYSEWRDGGLHAVTPIPEDIAYGFHIYRKGATVARYLHFLSEQEGQFLKQAPAHFSSYKFKTHNSQDLIRSLFNNQNVAIYSKAMEPVLNTAGWPHFRLADYEWHNVGSEWEMQKVVIKSSGKDNGGASPLPAMMTLTVFFEDGTKSVILLTDKEGKVLSKISVPRKPVSWMMNAEGSYPDATTVAYVPSNLKQDSVIEAVNLRVRIAKQQNFNTPVLIKAHWVGPDRDRGVEPGIALSSDRYWCIKTPEGWNEKDASFTVNYDGRSASNNASNYDAGFMSKYTEDSLVVMYRATIFQRWTICEHCTVSKANPSDKFGTVTAELKTGDYSIGVRDYKATITGSSSGAKKSKTNALSVYPNPTSGVLNMQLSTIGSTRIIPIDWTVIQADGKRVKKGNTPVQDNGDGTYSMGIEHLKAGAYFLVCHTSVGIFNQKFIVTGR